jgi:ATP-binding cassette subfamily B (MDR/TAP) protein 1
LVQQGISEKVALVVNFLAAFVTGFVLAYIRSWRLALALSSILPCIAITGAVMNKSVSKYMQYVILSYLFNLFFDVYNRLSLKHVAEGGSLAEEVIATVRTAQAFGSQQTLSGLYDSHIAESLKLELRSAIFLGGGLGSFFFVIYASYALS